MSTKGEFLLQKLGNMTRWVQTELGKENIPPEVVSQLASLSELEVCTLAGMLHANKHVLIHRDWVQIATLLRSDPRLSFAQLLLTEVQHRPDMHDKFWAYISLFIEVAEQ